MDAGPARSRGEGFGRRRGLSDASLTAFRQQTPHSDMAWKDVIGDRCDSVCHQEDKGCGLSEALAKFRLFFLVTASFKERA